MLGLKHHVRSVMTFLASMAGKARRKSLEKWNVQDGRMLRYLSWMAKKVQVKCQKVDHASLKSCVARDGDCLFCSPEHVLGFHRPSSIIIH